LGGTDNTSRGDQVVWGHFYANPTQVSWGSTNNPELFVKIWFDASGRIDVNFFHVSVPDIEVYTDYIADGSYDSKGTTITSDRYIRHEFTQGQSLPINYSGTWSTYEVIDGSSCGVGYYSETGTSTIQQNGNSLTITDDEGNIGSGTISGNNATIKITWYEEDDIFVTAVYSITLSGNSFSGTGNLTATGSFGSCPGTSTITGTKL
jgi:hypothetical protein